MPVCATRSRAPAPRCCSSKTRRNSAASGPPYSAATISTATEKACPARIDRDRNSRQSGNCCSKAATRRRALRRAYQSGNRANAAPAANASPGTVFPVGSATAVKPTRSRATDRCSSPPPHPSAGPPYPAAAPPRASAAASPVDGWPSVRPPRPRPQSASACPPAARPTRAAARGGQPPHRHRGRTPIGGRRNRPERSPAPSTPPPHPDAITPKRPPPSSPRTDGRAGGCPTPPAARCSAGARR